MTNPASWTLDGRGVLITGGNRGLGLAVAQTCLQLGAHVLICATDEAALAAAAERLAGSAPAGRVTTARADVSSPGEVERLFREVDQHLPALDGVVNSAGIYGPIGKFEELDWGEWTRTIDINLLGTALVCRHAIPRLRGRLSASIVNLSGGGATAPLPRFTAYAASKTAVVRLTETLADELRGDGIRVNAVAPGALNTRLLDRVIASGPDRAGDQFFERAQRQVIEGGASIENAAELCAFLLSSASYSVSGRLISAVWDPWRTFPESFERTATPDVYTLRRVTPKETPQ